MNLSEFISRLPGKGRWRGDYNAEWQCPAHEDGRASLSVGVGNKGGVVVHCFAGCTAEQILATLRLKFSDLMPSDDGWIPPPAEHKREIAWYSYRDTDGALLYQVVRYEPKTFRPRRRVEDDWVYDLKDVKLVPYRLPELLRADPEKPVWIVEGEKDVDHLWALGHVATTNPGGAGKWKAGWAEFFRGRSIIAVPDNDIPGRAHMDDVKKKLGREPRAVLIYRLEGVPEKGDISDYLAQPHEHDPLAEIIRDLEFMLEQRDEYMEAKERDRPNSFSVLDMRHLKIEYPKGNLDERLFCPQNVGCLYGPGGVYKTWLAMFLGGQLARALKLFNMATRENRVLFFSEEMTLPEIKMRGDQLWTAEEAEQIEHRLLFRFDSEFDFYAETSESEKKLHDAILEAKATFWFIDSLSRIHSGEENSNSDMIRVGRHLERVARVTNSAGCVIHHQGKGGGEFAHKGSARIRGATSLQNAFSDIINFSPMRKSHGNPRSMLSFEKTRHQKTPAAFGIVPLFDPSSRFSLEFFEIDEESESRREEHHNEDVRQLLAWMQDNLVPGKKMQSAELREAFRASGLMSKNKIEQAMIAGRKTGKIGWTQASGKGGPIEYWLLPELSGEDE